MSPRITPAQIPPSTCQPTSTQIAIFADPDFSGTCQLFSSGTYTTSTALGSLSNNAKSLLVGSSVMATFYNNNTLSSRGETFSISDSNLTDNRIGANNLSSLKVTPRTSLPQPPAPRWPSNNSSFSANTSLSLHWDDGGGASEFLARLDGPGAPLTRTWQSNAIWNLGSLATGTYTWKVKSRNTAGESPWSSIIGFSIQGTENGLTKEYSLVSYTAPFTDTFDQGYGAWSWSSNWDQTTSENHTPGGLASWTYDVSTAQNGYDNGLPNMGDLTSPPISLPPGTTNSLSFYYVYETEGSGKYWDQRWVQISADNGPYTNLHQLSDDPPNTWLKSSRIDLGAYQGKTVRIRFHFETLDNVENAFRGWFIDDFTITEAPTNLCSEPPNTDDNPADARLLTYNTSQDGLICGAGDIDFF